MRGAEFFAGIGLVRKALSQCGLEVVWANDIDSNKQLLYEANFGSDHFRLGDIRAVHGWQLPEVDFATASFPCTDLSLAGNRIGLQGTQSSMFWEFARVLREMKERRPKVVMLENVPSFATSNGGHDLYIALRRLNRLGYACDLLVIDARYFVPQSRPRLFIIGSRELLADSGTWDPSPLRPKWIQRFVHQHPDLKLQALSISLPEPDRRTLANVVERLGEDNERWWDDGRLQRFIRELSPIQRARLDVLMSSPQPSWATAYRRTRNSKPAWEIRADAISGCLRTARGGSSKQALVESGNNEFRVRWMTAVEYARLQGADDFNLAGVPENRALFGFGDAVCVPAVAWLASNYLLPLLSGHVEHAAIMRQKALALV